MLPYKLVFKMKKICEKNYRKRKHVTQLVDPVYEFERSMQIMIVRAIMEKGNHENEK